MFCPNCGNQMKEGAVFCSNCGYRNEGSSSKGLNFNFNKIPFVPILCLVVIVIVVLLVKNLFLSGSSFKSIKLVTAYSEDTTIDNMETLSESSFGSAKLVTSYSENTVIDNMETVKFGSYPQSDVSGNSKEPIEWIVLDRQGDKTLLLSKYILDCKCYNNERKDITWENCTLRYWLNRNFYNTAFTSSEQNKIETTNVTNNNNIDYGTNGGNNTNDKIFCLSIEEIRWYFGYGKKEDYGYQLGKNVVTRGTNYAKTIDNGSHTLYVHDGSGDSQYKWATGNSCFWLRSSGYNQRYADIVYYDGFISTDGDLVNIHLDGVRPALWVKN